MLVNLEPDCFIIFSGLFCHILRASKQIQLTRLLPLALEQDQPACTCNLILLYTLRFSIFDSVTETPSFLCLVISVYLSSLQVAHLSDAPRRRLVVTGIVQGYRTKLLRALSGSLTCSLYSTVTWDLGLTHSHTMTPFDAPGKEAFCKHCGKRRNCS